MTSLYEQIKDSFYGTLEVGIIVGIEVQVTLAQFKALIKDIAKENDASLIDWSIFDITEPIVLQIPNGRKVTVNVKEK